MKKLDDDAPHEEGVIRRLSAREMLARLYVRMKSERKSLGLGMLLLIVSVGLGLVLNVMYVRAQRARGFDDNGSSDDAS